MKETITISKDAYDRLVKLSLYVYDWYPNYVSCKHCGRYHPEGNICLNCGKSNCE